MDETMALGWIIVAGSLGTLLGATVGYYAAQVQQEQKLRTTNRKLNNL
ncbi:membrane protein [Microbacterium phage Shocker]|uniref:Membrane protein n=1 Tax=Microbacterium phage Shocker TaxID=2805839 RepID=A0A890V117_9CAUD|nr:membrane protein [Microbacterium phage Shocker]QRI45114.1 membrane protein [Microbacterium phage Shocker]